MKISPSAHPSTHDDEALALRLARVEWTRLSRGSTSQFDADILLSQDVIRRDARNSAFPRPDSPTRPPRQRPSGAVGAPAAPVESTMVQALNAFKTRELGAAVRCEYNRIMADPKLTSMRFCFCCAHEFYVRARIEFAATVALQAQHLFHDPFVLVEHGIGDGLQLALQTFALLHLGACEFKVVGTDTYPTAGIVHFGRYIDERAQRWGDKVSSEFYRCGAQHYVGAVSEEQLRLPHVLTMVRSDSSEQTQDFSWLASQLNAAIVETMPC